MGSIVSDFPALPLDSDPGRATTYAKVYDDLTAMGLPTPATPANAISRAALLAFLQAQAGAIVKAELTNDPEARGYTGAASDADRATLIVSEFSPNVATRWPGASPTGYSVISSSNSGMEAAIAGGGDPGFDVLLSNPVTGVFPVVYARFRNTTTTPALRGRFVRIDGVVSTNRLTFSVHAPLAPPAGNTFDLGYARSTILPPRIAVLLRRLPFAPNTLTAADITSAKV